MAVKIFVPAAVIYQFSIFERAEPLARPRLNRNTGSIFQPLDAQRAVRKALMDIEVEPLTDPFWLVAHFFDSEKKHYLATDTDNLVKALADNLQEMRVIDNDRQMMGITATKNLASEDWIYIELRAVKCLSIPSDHISRMLCMPSEMESISTTV